MPLDKPHELVERRACPVVTARQRHVRREPPPLGREAHALQGRLHLRRQMREAGRPLRPHPQRLHLPRPFEGADPRQSQVEGRRADAGQRLVHPLRLDAVHLADEAERQVEVFGGNPAQSGDAAGQARQAGLDIEGKIDGHEQTHRTKTSAPKESVPLNLAASRRPGPAAFRPRAGRAAPSPQRPPGWGGCRRPG